MKWRRFTVPVLGVLVLGAAACGNDDSGGGDGGDANAPELTGAPVKIMVIADGGQGDLNSADRVGGAAEVAAEAVNAAGGIQGSPVEIKTCESGLGDANLAAACARDAASGGFVAVDGAFTTAGDSYVPILEDAGVPTVAPFAISFSEFSSPVSYPIIGGAPSTTAGLGAQLADVGDEKINVTYLDVEQGALAATLVQEGLTPRDLEISSETPVPPETGDLSSVINAAEAENPDGIALVISETEAPRWIQQASELGVEATLAASSAAINPDDAKTLGAAGEGVLVTSNFVPVSQTDNAGVQQFLDEREQYAPDLDIDDSGMNAWGGVHLIADVLADATGDLTQPATLVQALNAAHDVDLGIIPPISFDVEPEPLFGGAITRLYNRSVVYAEIRDGEIVPQGELEFIDPFVAP